MTHGPDSLLQEIQRDLERTRAERELTAQEARSLLTC